MRRDRRVPAPVAALAGFMLSGCMVATHPPAGEGQEKVLVCHKGKRTLDVAAPAVDAHLGHGDTPGPCR